MLVKEFRLPFEPLVTERMQQGVGRLRVRQPLLAADVAGSVTTFATVAATATATVIAVMHLHAQRMCLERGPWAVRACGDDEPAIATAIAKWRHQENRATTKNRRAPIPHRPQLSSAVCVSWNHKTSFSVSTGI